MFIVLGPIPTDCGVITAPAPKPSELSLISQPGNCIDVSSPQNRAPLQVNDCNNHSNQKFTFGSGMRDARGQCVTAVPQEELQQEALGVDTSTWERAWPLTGWECLHRSNISFVLIEGYRSKADGGNSSDFGGHVVATAPQTARNARAAGIKNIDLYHFPDTAIDPTQQIHDTVRYFAAQNISFGKLWLDVEGPEYWNKSWQVHEQSAFACDL